MPGSVSKPARPALSGSSKRRNSAVRNGPRPLQKPRQRNRLKQNRRHSRAKPWTTVPPRPPWCSRRWSGKRPRPPKPQLRLHRLKRLHHLTLQGKSRRCRISRHWRSSLCRLRASSIPCKACWKKRSEEHTSELQSRPHLVCRLLLEKKKKIKETVYSDTQNIAHTPSSLSHTINQNRQLKQTYCATVAFVFIDFSSLIYYWLLVRSVA